MKLWRNSRFDEEYELTPEEVVDQFARSPFGQWELYPWPIDRAVCAFIGDREGLSSTFESSDPDYQAVLAAAEERRA